MHGTTTHSLDCGVNAVLSCGARIVHGALTAYTFIIIIIITTNSLLTGPKVKSNEIKLQRVKITLARIIVRPEKFDLTTPVLKKLFWNV